MIPLRVFLGWDADEMIAHVVAAFSMRARASRELDVQRLALGELQASGLYTRPTARVDGRLWDEASGAPMSTGHAIGRFFVPTLCQFSGWALFADGDILVRADLAQLFALADPKFAVQVVQHPPMQAVATKKDGAVQQLYARKNWSSVMLFNCGHPAHKALTLDALNTWPGRDLHAFAWLPDDLIGALPPTWNVLIGETDPVPDPVAIAHYTLGTPNLPGHAHDAFADEWYGLAKAAGYRLTRPAIAEAVA